MNPRDRCYSQISIKDQSTHAESQAWLQVQQGSTTLQSGSYNMSALSKMTQPGQPTGAPVKKGENIINEKISKARMKLKEFQRSKRKLHVAQLNGEREGNLQKAYALHETVQLKQGSTQKLSKK